MLNGLGFYIKQEKWMRNIIRENESYTFYSSSCLRNKLCNSQHTDTKGHQNKTKTTQKLSLHTNCMTSHGRHFYTQVHMTPKASVNIEDRLWRDFPGSPVVKESTCQYTDMGSIPDLGRPHMMQSKRVAPTCCQLETTCTQQWRPSTAKNK